MKYLLILLLLLASCSKLKYGHVVYKGYNPPSYLQTVLPMVIPDGNGGFTTMMIPYTIYTNGSYYINVKGKDKDGENVEETFYVNKAYIDTVPIGQFVCVDGFCTEDTSIHKTEKK